VILSAVNIFDIGSVSAQQEMYQAWTMPELFPDERQPVLRNWHPEDLAAYCGGQYTKFEN
jgi:hypothetical protein